MRKDVKLAFRIRVAWTAGIINGQRTRTAASLSHNGLVHLGHSLVVCLSTRVVPARIAPGDQTYKRCILRSPKTCDATEKQQWVGLPSKIFQFLKVLINLTQQKGNECISSVWGKIWLCPEVINGNQSEHVHLSTTILKTFRVKESQNNRPPIIRLTGEPYGHTSF